MMNLGFPESAITHPGQSGTGRFRFIGKASWPGSLDPISHHSFVGSSLTRILMAA